MWNVDNLDALLALEAKATPGPWEHGPETGAGSVWVYKHGSPLAEPESPRGWLRSLKGRVKLFMMRKRVVYGHYGLRDAPPLSGNLGDPVWAQQEANAALIVAARNSLRPLVERVKELEAQKDGAYKERDLSEAMVKPDVDAQVSQAMAQLCITLNARAKEVEGG